MHKIKIITEKNVGSQKYLDMQSDKKCYWFANNAQVVTKTAYKAI